MGVCVGGGDGGEHKGEAVLKMGVCRVMGMWCMMVYELG